MQICTISFLAALVGSATAFHPNILFTSSPRSKKISSLSATRRQFLVLSFLALISSVRAFVPLGGRPETTTTTTIRHVETALDATRRPFLSGNWKLNPSTRAEAIQLATDIRSTITKDTPDADIALFVPYIYIEPVMNAVAGTIQVGAEVRVLSFFFG